VTGFGRILDDLNRAGVLYVLIGGIALIRHGVVRATRDIAAVFDPDPANVEHIRALIERWRATRPDGSPVPEDRVAGDRTIHMATPYGDLDLLSERSAGLSFAELLTRADTRRVEGRDRDLVDLADLESAHGDLPDSRT
jgi:hypothetical protein